MDGQLDLCATATIKESLKRIGCFSNPLDGFCPVREKAAAVPALFPWAAEWIQPGMFVVKTGGKAWEAPADRMVGAVEALGCGGWDETDALHHVGIDLDVGHGKPEQQYETTEAAITAARQIRELVGGAAEIRRSKGGVGIHVRIRIATGVVSVNGRKSAPLIAKWIAGKLSIRCDHSVLGRQALWVWSREVGEHGFELIEACNGSWTPPAEAMQKPVVPAVRGFTPKNSTAIRWDLVRRAAAYLKRMPIAVEGHGGDSLTFHVVCTALQGFDLTEEETFEALREWNERCDPSWNEKDLRRKISEAMKNAGPRGRFLKDQKPKRETPSAADIAEKFLREKNYRLGGELHLRYYREDWWRWTNTHYERIRDSEMEAEVVAFLQSDPATRDAAGPGIIWGQSQPL